MPCLGLTAGCIKKKPMSVMLFGKSNNEKRHNHVFELFSLNFTMYTYTSGWIVQPTMTALHFIIEAKRPGPHRLQLFQNKQIIRVKFASRGVDHIIFSF